MTLVFPQHLSRRHGRAIWQRTQFFKRYKKLQNKIPVLNCLPSTALSQPSATSVLLLKQLNLHVCQF